MENTGIYKHIQRSNRNLLAVNICLVLSVIAIAGMSRRYLYNFFFGPFPIDNQTLLSNTTPDSRLQYFVKIRGSESLNTGVQEVEREVSKSTGETKSETVKAHYLALVIEQKLLLVKTPNANDSKEFTGALITLPNDAREKIVNEAEAEFPALRGVFLPLMLDATNFRNSGYIGLGIGIPLFLLGVWNLFKVVKRKENIENHPIMEDLKRFGSPNDVAFKIDSELQIAGNKSTIGPAQITPSWILRSHFFGLEILNLNDIVWIYKNVTTHYKYFIPVGKTYAVVIYNRQGRLLEIPCKEQEVTSIIEQVITYVPWVIAGYSQELQEVWQKNFSQMIEFVDMKRQEISN
ncbi:hypothetical protein CLI64_14480 [Nostoc sp. CENA543]|uniref:DUF6709 family protein n=1 Tax=Nostoc sp. CENA543 TaxID=1869241 RepID=UPI000CA2CB37|nr:DUF6709 family protein [Nostoc sp. CENA543]AUT01499.1 hypothetical protein CLI64_14480 [Nostoc sp. CENA543]